MPAPSQQETTELLLCWSRGDDSALNQLIPRVYRELQRLAHSYMAGERADHTLQTTALVNEAFIRLIDCRRIQWQDRAHFLAISAQLMRRILVDFARSRSYLKRGGRTQRVSLAEEMLVSREKGEDVEALDNGLKELTRMDPRMGKVVELRFFGGLSVAETAEVLKVSKGTVMRDWRLAKSWLLRELGGQERDES